jgi:hypothetical protein
VSDQNFASDYPKKKDVPPVDFFQCFYYAYLNAADIPFREHVSQLFDHYRRHPFLGKHRFKGELKVLQLSRLC